MADTKYYAWNNFRVVNPDKPGDRSAAKVIKPGDEVSQSDLKVSDEDWQAYIANGAVRPYQHPDVGSFGGSPVEYEKARMAAAIEGEYFDPQYGLVTNNPPEVDPESGKKLTTPAK